MEVPLIKELVTIFCLSIVVIYACHKVRIPPILGFLLTGIVCGPYGLKLVSAVHEVELMAEIGIVFLLFSIGLEHLSVAELIRLKKPVFIGGTSQVFLTIIAIGALYFLFVGHAVGAAVFAGCVFSLSSTAIVLGCLQQKAQVDTPPGRIMLAILLYQDLVIVPMVLVAPLLAGQSKVLGWESLIAAGSTVLIIGSSFFLARKVVPWLMRLIVHTKIRELFLFSTLGICLAIAYLTSLFGLSLSLGAFLAGLILAESEYSHTALEGVMPFRDVFTSLFFISVGMLLNTAFFWEHLGGVFGLTVVIMAVKAVCAGMVGKILGYPLRAAIIVGLGLCQVGEFSFVLADYGRQYQLFSDEAYQMVLATIILTMAFTPFIMNLAPSFAAKVSGRIAAWRHRPRADGEDETPEESKLKDHLIILGYGVGGKHLSRAARMAGIPYNILEMNPETVRLFNGKEPIMHGDASHPAVLEALGIHRARVLAIVISDPSATRAVTEVAAHLNPGLHIMVRTRFLGEVPYLKALGASDVIPEEFETSIEIFTRVLTYYLVPRSDIEHFTGEIRAENYDSLRERDTAGATLGTLRDSIPDLSVSALRVEQGSPLDGVTLKDSNLRQKANLTVVAVRSGEATTANPGGDYRLRAGDIAYVFSTGEDAALAVDFFTSASDAA